MPQIKNIYQLRLFALASAIFFILGFNAWFLNFHFKNVSDQEELVTHTAEVMSELDLTLSSVKDAETGVRGYLLARKAEYLEPYQKGTIETWDHLSKVKSLTMNNPSQQVAIATIADTVKKRFHILEDFLDAFRRGGGKIDSKSVQLSEGKTVMDTLRTQVERMKRTEESFLSARTAVVERSKYFFFWALFLTTLLSAMIITAAFFQISKTQARISKEAIEKAKEAQDKETASACARLLSGDITVETAGQRTLEFLSKTFGSLAGRLFILDQGHLKAIASYAVGDGASHTTPGGFKSELGLVQAALARNEMWEIESVPADYWQISSALGNAIPRTLSFLPFSFQNQPLGVFELASFSLLDQDQKRLLLSLRDVFGIGLNAAQSRGHLQSLLERTQQQSEELQAQQEELRTNNEELEQQARALESQQHALNIKNKELELAQGELQYKASELERSSQYKSDFLAKMSHELRTPLNGLLILSTLLLENKEGTLTPRQREFARSINNAGNDLLILINDILDLSKIEARKLSLRPERFTLESLIKSKQRTFEPQVAAKGLEFITDLPEEISSLQLFTDRQRLEQVLRNFLSNAIKFTENGSVRLQVTTDEKKNHITFTVIDTGIGIPKDKQELVFNAFEQADSSVSRKYGGTGLGLTISRELAALLGGEVFLESEVGHGSQFSIRIPKDLKEVKASEGQDASTSAPLSRPIIPAPLPDKPPQRFNENSKAFARAALQNLDKTKKTILVVEDDERFRSSIVDTIKTFDFQPIEAADGEVAIAILHEHVPDAILLDIKLPGISGFGILEMIKQLPNLRHVPVHMISAMEYQPNTLRMGALGYLTKPVTMEKVRSAIERIENMLSKNLRRVLLIEDDDRQSKAISDLIGADDIEVISAKTGKTAVLELKKGAFDCIILDLTLPDVSGFDVLSELSLLDISVPPVVIYTGKELSEEEESYLRKYSESIIIKGARSPERLLDEVNLFLHRVESLLPTEKRQMLSQLRSQEKSFEGKTVLVVDDDIRNVFALTSALETKGIQIRVARDGFETLEALRTHPDIDLVLMDIMMPKMDGFEAMKRIRQSQDSRIKAIPIVALTAKAMREDHEKCMQAGANDYLPKPVNLDNLMTVLKMWLTPKGFFS